MTLSLVRTLVQRRHSCGKDEACTAPPRSAGSRRKFCDIFPCAGSLHTTRKRPQTEHGENCEVTLKMIKGKARVRASDSVISRAFLKAGIKARTLRQKPIRPKDAEKERVATCKVNDQRGGARACAPLCTQDPRPRPTSVLSV